LTLVGWTLLARGETEPEQIGVEVRPAAKLREDGRIEVALQHWSNGSWSRGVYPTRRYLTVDADEECWLVSKPVRETSWPRSDKIETRVSCVSSPSVVGGALQRWSSVSRSSPLSGMS